MSAVTIERIAAGGDGVGRLPDGMTVFVPRTAPGDVLEIEVQERKRSYARGRIHVLRAASGERAEPPCRHYIDDGCGGCQLQHLSPGAQLEAKRRVVGDAVRRIGTRDWPDPPIVPSPEAWRYRQKITLAVKGDRIGLHPHDDPRAVFRLTDCPITSAGLMALWQRLASHRDGLPATLTGLVLREDREGGRHVVVEGAGDRPWDATPLATAVAEPDVTYWWRPEGGAARVVAGRTTAFPALAFEQVNPGFAARIRADAVTALGARRTVWDLYAGVGDAAVALAARGAEVWAVEMDRAAVEWARSAARVDVNWVAGRVEEVLHRLPEPDAVIVNPPRVGMARAVTARLDRWAKGQSGRRVAYVSCDPATLARDLARMPSLTLRDLTAYDLFPQTSHVEALAVLETA